MERLNVNPTRMMLTMLKKRLATSVRGHKLLKDKRDELMKGFLELARENKELRDKVEARLTDVYAAFGVAQAVMSHGRSSDVSEAGRELRCLRQECHERGRSGV